MYWEHLGLLHKTDYRQRWEEKLAWYKQQGILPFEESEESASAILMTSKDDANGGINVKEIGDMLDCLLT